MTTIQRDTAGKRVAKGSTLCAYTDCRKVIPNKYGEPGVSMSRVDGKTLICSSCGTREAFGQVPANRLYCGPVNVRGRK